MRRVMILKFLAGVAIAAAALFGASSAASAATYGPTGGLSVCSATSITCASDTVVLPPHWYF